MWARGLKLGHLQGAVVGKLSCPMWARGLKHVFEARQLVNDEVAPHVGAWIETESRPPEAIRHTSRPMWARGLKHGYKELYFNIFMVAPHVGAWIETLPRRCRCTFSASRPMWARGLKLRCRRHHHRCGSRAPVGATTTLDYFATSMQNVCCHISPIYLAYYSHTDPIVMPYYCHTLAILESMAALWHQYGNSMASTCQILAKYLPDTWLGRRNVMGFVYLCGQERRRLRLRRTNRYLT